MSRILHAIAIRINRPRSLIHLRYARQSPSHISFARLHFSSFFSAVARSINYGATLGSSALLTYFYHARRNQLSTRKLTEARRKDFCAEYFRSRTFHAPRHFHTLAFLWKNRTFPAMRIRGHAEKFKFQQPPRRGTGN